MKILLDTNIVVRLMQPSDKNHQACLDAVEKLPKLGYDLSLVPQVMYEFWAVATRPINANGLGLSSEQAEQETEQFQSMFLLLKDERSIFNYWIKLVTHFNVLGRNSHDARLIAAMDRHGISHLLTLDKKDFNRFSHKTIWKPSDVIALQLDA